MDCGQSGNSYKAGGARLMATKLTFTKGQLDNLNGFFRQSIERENSTMIMGQLTGMSLEVNESGERKDEIITLELHDQVNFEDFVQEPLPDDVIFPAELNTFLRDRIRDLQSENGHLRQELDESRENLQNLQKFSEKEKSKTNEDVEIKISELSKRCRHQSAELESLKTKCKKLVDKMAAKDAEMAETLANIKMDEKEIADSTTLTNEETKTIQDEISIKDDQVKILNEKLAHTSAKLYETKNTCTYLRQEVNKAQKLLCSEVGESVTIASLSNRPSGWRGRAQQVQQLQQKNFELQSKLNDYEKSSKSASNFTVSTEQRNVAYLRNLEKERRQAVENSTRELRQAEIGLETCQRKMQAARARIKILENDLNNARTNLVLLNEKRIHDDQLIEALNGQLGAVEEKFRERERLTRNQKEKTEESCKELQNELSAVNMQVELLRKKLEERETEIENLRNGVETKKKPERAWQSPPKNIIQESPVETPRNIKNPNEYVTMSLAAEAERQRLLELVTHLNRRVDKERTDTDHISELLRQERNKNARLETKLQRFEMERVGMAKINTGYRSKFSKSFLNSTTRENPNSEKIQFKLELLEEECLALKARLATIQQDKATDLAIYKKMLEQTRRTFQDAFRGKINYTAGCHSNVTI